jgi:hypothetical protein
VRALSPRGGPHTATDHVGTEIYGQSGPCRVATDAAIKTAITGQCGNTSEKQHSLLLPVAVNLNRHRAGSIKAEAAQRVALLRNESFALRGLQLNKRTKNARSGAKMGRTGKVRISLAL